MAQSSHWILIISRIFRHIEQYFPLHIQPLLYKQHCPKTHTHTLFENKGGVGWRNTDFFLKSSPTFSGGKISMDKFVILLFGFLLNYVLSLKTSASVLCIMFSLSTTRKLSASVSCNMYSTTYFLNNNKKCISFMQHALHKSRLKIKSLLAT